MCKVRSKKFYFFRNSSIAFLMICACGVSVSRHLALKASAVSLGTYTAICVYVFALYRLFTAVLVWVLRLFSIDFAPESWYSVEQEGGSLWSVLVAPLYQVYSLERSRCRTRWRLFLFVCQTQIDDCNDQHTQGENPLVCNHGNHPLFGGTTRRPLDYAINITY